jgi:NAD(P)-dependent dehydrogenase (short-subunit alcohol dehydrogenase family)
MKHAGVCARSRDATADGEITLAAGQQALVTGAGSGIGRAIALALAREGLNLVLVGRDRHKLGAVAGEAATPVRMVTADLATTEGLNVVVDAVGDRLHVIVHCAGGYLREPIASLSANAWRPLEELNVRAPILLVAGCLGRLRAAQGQVVFINSTAALSSGSPGLAAYAASKHALKAAADVLRQEVNPYGIRVLSIFPGRTDTPMQRAVLSGEGRSAPPGGLMLPDDIASMTIAALRLPRSAEVTDIIMRPMRPL